MVRWLQELTLYDPDNKIAWFTKKRVTVENENYFMELVSDGTCEA